MNQAYPVSYTHLIPDAVLNQYFPGKQEQIKLALKESADISLLSQCPFLLINKGNQVRTIADQIFEEAQISPPILLETENIETTFALAVKGMGITFYPKMFITDSDMKTQTADVYKRQA